MAEIGIPENRVKAWCKRWSLAVTFFAVSGCAHYPVLPAHLQGKAIIVMGFDTDNLRPYEGGTLSTGLRLERINGTALNPALQRYEYRIVEPGPVQVEGHCFWRLRGTFWNAPADLNEPGSLRWQAEPNHIYTLSGAIDEYKVRCDISYFDKPSAP